MKKLGLLVPAIACVCQGIAADKFTVNAEDLVNDNYKTMLKKAWITNKIKKNLKKKNADKSALLSVEQRLLDICSRHDSAKEFSKHIKTEWDTTHADKIILKVSRIVGYHDVPYNQTEVDFIIPGMIDGKQVEIGRKCFKMPGIHNLFLNIKFQEKKGAKVKFNQNCSEMFMQTGNGSSIKTINFTGANMSNVTDMESIFSGCKNLTSLNLSNFDTKNVINMEDMFNGCNNLTSLDLRNFDTQNVTNMKSMFFGCKSLTFLDLKNFNTANVVDMDDMFRNCHNLLSLNLDNFNIRNVPPLDLKHIFQGCLNLLNQEELEKELGING